MAIFFSPGEEKIRPGVYQRYTKEQGSQYASALNGVCAIPVKADWGPVGVVTECQSARDVINTFGNAGDNNTTNAALAMFKGGASKVYIYRMGAGGAVGALTLNNEDGVAVATVTAKHPGNRAIAISVQAKIGDATKKEFIVYDGSALVERFTFAVGESEDEVANMVTAVRSEYVTVAAVDGATGVLATVEMASGALAGGANPTVTNADYSTAFEALEPYAYNVIALDVDDDATLTLSNLLAEYMRNAHQRGKLSMVVVGEKITVPFKNRCDDAKAFNDEKVVFFGSGYLDAAGNVVDGVEAICYTAGLVAGTPANQSIVHATYNGAVELAENLTNAQHEAAITSGMLTLSRSADGTIWYDSGVNTLVSPGINQDEGWKKIRRCKTRFEVMDRIDRTVAPCVGKINCDPDGVAFILQLGNGVLQEMIAERKIFPGATMIEDPENPYKADSAWFLINIDDIDSLEKIYLHYVFRYSQNT